jgi:hypothetical protein
MNACTAIAWLITSDWRLSASAIDHEGVLSPLVILRVRQIRKQIAHMGQPVMRGFVEFAKHNLAAICLVAAVEVIPRANSRNYATFAATA